jgi:curli biogenesis system outer membrane secretion channel CsgG
MLGFIPALAYAQAVSYNDAIKVIAVNIEAKITSADIVAIVSFQSSTSQFTNRVIDDLINELVKGNARVVDRQNLEKIHAEQNYQLSGYVDDDSAVSIGHELGAAAIIVGTGENMIDYYRFNFRMLSVKTAEILMQSSVNVRYDSTMRRLLNNQAYNSGGIGNTHFLIGARLGAGFEMNTADEDMVGSGFSPKEKSNTAFNATLFGAFKFNESWVIQPEVIFMLNNGMEISGQGITITIDYPTLDIPLLARWNFILKPVLAGIVLGPYISLPLGRLNLSVGDKGSALDTTGYTFGATGGFVIGIKAGPGHITGDLRFLHDFSSLKVREDFGDGMQDENIAIRRSINLTIGYELSL